MLPSALSRAALLSDPICLLQEEPTPAQPPPSVLGPAPSQASLVRLSSSWKSRSRKSLASPCPRKSLSRFVATSWRHSVLVVSSMSEISCPGPCRERRGGSQTLSSGDLRAPEGKRTFSPRGGWGWGPGYWPAPHIPRPQFSALQNGFRRTEAQAYHRWTLPPCPEPPHLHAQLHFMAQQLHQRLVAAGRQHHLVPQPHLQLQGAQVAPGMGSL